MKIKTCLTVLTALFFLGCSNYSAIEKKAIDSMKQEIYTYYKEYYNEDWSINFDEITSMYYNDSVSIVWAKYNAKCKNEAEDQMIEYIYCVSGEHKYSLINPCLMEGSAELPFSNENIVNAMGGYIGENVYNAIKDSILPNQNLNYKDAQAYLAIKQLNQSGQEIGSEERWREMIPTQGKTGEWELGSVEALTKIEGEEKRFFILNSASPYNYLINETEKPILKIIIGKHEVWLVLYKDTDFTLTAETATGESFDLGNWNNYYKQLDPYIYSTLGNRNENFQFLLKNEEPFMLILTPNFVMGRGFEEMRSMYFDFYPQGFKEALKQL